jgi:Spy/CpxP family protein refolding chaperone
MQRRIVFTFIGLGIIILLGMAIMFSCGPRYGYNHMYGDQDDGYDGMMGPGYRDRYGRMMGPGYGDRYGGMMGPEYGRGYGENNNLGLMSSELKLTDEQTKQIYDLASRYRAKYYENRGNMQELGNLEQQHRKDIEKILTPEQKKTFEKYNRGFDRYSWFGGCPYH